MEKISTAEFEVMRVIWANQSVYTKDILSILKSQENWGDSTIKTLLSRLVKKNFVEVDQSTSKFKYTAKVDKNQYIISEMQDLLSKACSTQQPNILMAVINHMDLDDDASQQFLDALHHKRKTEKLQCHCPKGMCDYEKTS